LLEAGEIREMVQNAINLLSSVYREVLVLRDLQRLTIKETMTILGISEAAVKTRLHRAACSYETAWRLGSTVVGSKGNRIEKLDRGEWEGQHENN
jgi:DNA-directed RNA polymerase specialized sigma24 family protein